MRKPIYNKQYFKDARRDLRKDSTHEEERFWFEVRNSKLGFRFKRQESIGIYIVDFYCPKKKLAIEIDGSQHNENIEYDEERTRYLNSYGIKVLRFWNEEINSDIDKVIDKVFQTLSCI
jgi:very-short-patch-repair endonuclease